VEDTYDRDADRIVRKQEVQCLRCPKTRTDFTDPRDGTKVKRSTYTEVERFRVLEPVLRGRADYRRESLRRQLNRQRQAKRQAS
jgi:hypothetical protein